MRRPLATPGRSRKSIGAAADVVANSLPSMIPPEIAGDANTARAYYDQAATAAANISVGTDSHGFPTVTLSPQAAQMTEDLLNGVVYGVPVLGQAYALFLAFMPKAGAGPGTCTTDPPHVANPKAPTAAELKAWPHYWSWQQAHGPYAPGAPGSFESYANPILEWNWTLQQQCFSDLSMPAPVLLAALIHSWNIAHANTSTRTITRTGLNPQGWTPPPIDDPIADALAGSIQNSDPNCNPFQPCGPFNVTTSFQINTGGLKLKPIHLTLKPAPVAAKAPASSSSSSGVLVVAALAAAGAGAWYVHTRGWPKVIRKYL